MNDDLRFDPVDHELRRRFADTGSASGDPDAVLDSMRPRLQRARTRRRAAFTGAVATVAVAVVAVSFAMAGGGGSSVRTPPATHSTVPRPDPPAPSTTAPGISPAPDGAVKERGSNGGGTIGAPESTQPGAHSGTGNSNSGDGTPTTPTVAPPASEEHSYTSAGGSITVVFADGQVSLASNTAAAGYTAEIHDNGPTRVEVRFNNGQTEWRIRVDVVNGELVAEVTQH